MDGGQSAKKPKGPSRTAIDWLLGGTATAIGNYFGSPPARLPKSQLNWSAALALSAAA